jgi:arsenate reductase
MPRVLFLCTGNSCRSQMAEGWLRHLGGERFSAHSAGIEAHGLNPNAVAVMAEAGVDISGHTSQVIDDSADQTFDFFVTVCDHARETCPITPPGATTLHWSFDDPPRLCRDGGLEGDAALQVYRRVRDEVRAEVEAFIEQA